MGEEEGDRVFEVLDHWVALVFRPHSERDL